MAPDRIVVVGAGLGGARAVRTLRRQGFEGSLTLVGAEPHLPYDRPPLSKKYLAGETEVPTLESETALADLGVDLVLGCRVAAIQVGGAVLEDGTVVPFDAAIVATGAAPRRLPGTPALAGVHVLRSLDDADAIRADLGRAARVVVVGAGFIGAEVAATCRGLGHEVTLLEAAPVPLEHALGREMGEVCAAYHRDAGVDLRCGVGVAGFEGNRRIEAVLLADGGTVAADLVVVGIGVTPVVDLFDGSGATVENGVHVDEYLHTAIPGIYAVGDIANAVSPRFAGRFRVEHWDDAGAAGAVAARNVLGAAEVYDPVPYFWSDQYDLLLQYIGHAPSWDEIVVRGDPAERSFVAFYLVGGDLRAAFGANRARDVVTARRLVGAGLTPPVDVLADPDGDLRAFL